MPYSVLSAILVDMRACDVAIACKLGARNVQFAERIRAK